MKIKIYLLLAIIFLCFTGMKCEGHRKVIKDLSSIKVENLTNQGENLIFVKGSIKQELYTLGVKYLDQNMQEQDYMCYFQRHIVKQKIFSNTTIDSKYPKGSDVSCFFNAYPNTSYNGVKYKLIRKIYSGIYSFKIRLYKEDGSIIERDTEPIELL